MSANQNTHNKDLLGWQDIAGIVLGALDGPGVMHQTGLVQ